MKARNRSYIHDWTKIYVIFSFCIGHKYPADVRIPWIGHPEQVHIHLPLPLPVQFTEDFVLEKDNQLRSKHQTSQFTKGSVVVC